MVPEFFEGWGHADDALSFVCFLISVAKLGWGYCDFPDIYVYTYVVAPTRSIEQQ